MPEDLKINYLELPAADFPAQQQFYANAFGWTFTPYGEDYLAFHDGSQDGGFFRSTKRSRQDSGGALIVLYAKDLEAAQNRVLQAGGQVAKEIFSFPGGRRFHFHDPHGNELAIWSEQ